MGAQFVDPFRREAEEYLAAGAIESVSFSGPTYQIEVIDQRTKESVWPFLHFDEEGMLDDAFCSCGSEETCVHLAAAFLRIYNGTAEPLHVRFEKSFWNALCTLFARQCGFVAAAKIKEGAREFTLTAKTKKGRAWVHTLLEKRPKETPETSLNFSNIAQEEIMRWKEGRASFSLLYALSFWSDVAKHLMALQDEKKSCQITFKEKGGLPLLLTLSTSEFEVKVSLLPEDLPLLIPSLATVASPLKIYPLSKTTIASLSFNPLKPSFEIVRREEGKVIRKGEQRIDGWSYVPGEGFTPLDPAPFLDKQTILPEEISPFLDLYHLELAPLFEGVEIHETKVSLSYHLAFDTAWNLHITSYLFKKGDARVFGNWAYIPSKGFFPLRPPLFAPEGEIIEEKAVSTFVHYHRNFLNAIPGFSLHLATIESAVTYRVLKEGTIRFLSQFPGDSQEMKDFGDWVYYRTQGFFPKKALRASSVLFSGLEVLPADVHSFIKVNREELEALPHFFSPLPLITARGLTLKVDEECLEIAPECALASPYQGCACRFYGDFLYVEDAGFQELPAEMRLPVKYRDKIILGREELPYFFEHEFASLKPFFKTLDPRVEAPHKLDLVLTHLAKEASGFSLDGYYEGVEGRLSLADLKSAFAEGKQFLFSEAGRIDLHDKRFAWVKGASVPLHLNLLEVIRLDLSEGLFSRDSHVTTLLEQLREMKAGEEPSLKGFPCTLRLYQRRGLDWLWFLYRNRLSGLLCDEMGLGKTHQAMALMAAVLQLKKEEKRSECRFLIVAPTSVIYHWQEKLHTFLPGVKVHFFHGLKRSLKRLSKKGILLTSYGIARSERKALSKIAFEIAIFDEIQVAKNPSSRIHQALLTLQANMRLGLTGTPIENYLRELKSLFDLVLPSYMPPEGEFKESFTLPIERGESEAKAILSRMIHPFILRRKKQEVLSELPEKTVDTLSCDLSEEQRLLYAEMIERERKPLLEKLKEGQTPIPYIHIFSLLSKLKQICNHPALVLKEGENYALHSSGKWDLFTELLEEAMEGEQKVVIFSQYLTMLDIIARHLNEKGLKYAEIRGATLNRQEQIARFSTDPQCRIFLGSLGAAGLGIDLTAASIVILYDRWWNAARENQAIDRVHRIGQKWGVQVYKLITKGTIEEKIDLMVARKGRLLEEIVASDDETMIKRLSREELIDLFSFSLKK